LRNATVKNLNLSVKSIDVDMTGPSSSSLRVGVLAGSASGIGASVVIENCHAMSESGGGITVSTTENSGGIIVGGLVADIGHGNDSDAKLAFVSGCSADIDIDVTHNSTSSVSVTQGGLIGSTNSALRNSRAHGNRQ
jgi:hypothetical protein